MKTPVVASVEMGYGHLRPAHALASALGTELLHVDLPPLVAPEELRLWRASRRFYEITSRASQIPVAGAPLRSLLESLTSIPHLHPQRDLSAPNLQVRSLHRLIEKGLGRGLVNLLKSTGAPLLTTFFAPAISADCSGCEEVYCVVTDVDINRTWVPLRPERSKIVYLTPSRRAIHRLRAYGIARERIEFTGFPLPHELIGGPDLSVLRKNLTARLVRLDRKKVFRDQARGEIHHFLGDLPADEEGRPPLITFSVGGAGAQADLARSLLKGLHSLIEENRLRLCLVAGVRAEIAAKFHQWVKEAGLEDRLGSGVDVFLAASLEEYFPRFNELLAETDVLWTKPSEMTFFSALGLPLILSAPVGVHERYNRRWAIENGPGLKQRDPLYAEYWMREWLNEGTLAAAAWYGFLRMPKFGLYQILERVGRRFNPAEDRGRPRLDQGCAGILIA
ncbi:MAG TPA: hypothetical protein VGX68_03675 [Thermoanaerobaculia bacterium]|jgi:hypothetical protein|nr:hypothetical protein [Thermoanaerobaculia bacterium]